MKKLMLIVVLVVAGLCPAGVLHTWDGGSGNWNDELMWDPNTVPTLSDDVDFSNGGNCTLQVGERAYFAMMTINHGSVSLNGDIFCPASPVFMGVTEGYASLTIGGNIDVAQIIEVTFPAEVHVYGGVSSIPIIYVDTLRLYGGNVTCFDFSGRLMVQEGHIGSDSCILGDLDCNGYVDFQDFALFALHWMDS